MQPNVQQVNSTAGGWKWLLVTRNKRSNSFTCARGCRTSSSGETEVTDATMMCFCVPSENSVLRAPPSRLHRHPADQPCFPAEITADLPLHEPTAPERSDKNRARRAEDSSPSDQPGGHYISAAERPTPLTFGESFFFFLCVALCQDADPPRLHQAVSC